MEKMKKNADGRESRAAEIARVIGRAARARRVILFGSAARGEMKKNSDWDFLVVIPERCHRWKASHRAWDALGWEYECPPLDIIVVREDEVRKYRDRHYSVIHHALNEGREIWVNDNPRESLARQEMQGSPEDAGEGVKQSAQAN